MSKESIKEIDSRLKMAEDAEREQLMKVYAPDDRAGVQKLLEKLSLIPHLRAHET